MIFLHVCFTRGTYDYFRKPTVALHSNGEKLISLLEQRWAGHLATVRAVLNSFQNLNCLSKKWALQGRIKQKHI